MQESTRTLDPQSPKSAPDRSKLDLLIRKLRGGGARKPAATIPRQRRGPDGAGTFAPSVGQQRLWLLQKLAPESPAYNVAGAIDLHGTLDEAALAAAFAEIVRRHETLRTSLRASGDEQTVAVVAAAAPCPPPGIDLTALEPTRRAREAEALGHALAHQPFDLERGSLLRTRLLRLGEDRHRLLVCLHHVICDGWSLRLLLRELSRAYGALAAGRRPRLPELPAQYVDFAAWQRQRLEGEAFERRLGYWQEQLAGLERLELPSDRPRSAARGRGARIETLYCAETTAELGRLARARGATLFMVLEAAFATLLGRFSGQRDVAVGTPVAGRERRELEGLIGFFVNTLVLRNDLGSTSGPLERQSSFEELLERARELVLAAQAHQDVPFEKLVEKLAPERQLNATPLFQVMLTFEAQALLPETVAGLVWTPRAIFTDTSKFELSLELTDLGGKVAGTLEYDRDLFDSATASRIGRSFETLLAGIAADPEARLGELPLLTREEKHQVLREWNDTAAPRPDDAGLATLVFEQARRAPHAAALLRGPETLSYGALAQRSERLARRLRRAGITPETIVGLCLERRLELIEAILAVLRAGGAYVPLDPSYPDKRLRLILEDTRAALVVTRSELRPRLGKLRTRVYFLDRDRDRPARLAPVLPPLAQVRLADRLAYLIYTSGSTGRPKGVAISHRNAAALLSWARRAFSAEELDLALAATSINFDLSIFEIFVPLTRGGTVVLARDALELPELPQRTRLRLINTVPSAAAELARQRALPASVRTINLAGEPLRRTLVDELRRAAPRARVLNLYGPSEDTTYSTFTAVSGRAGEPTIGFPLEGTRAYVVDRSLRPAPVGVSGELLLAGHGLARGYLARPALTAAAFVPDPFAERPGGRLYRTGDLVRQHASGELVFLGRRDHQIKIRGFRVELGEIEAQLGRNPEVREAVVVATSGDRDDARLTAFLLAAGEAPLDPSTLRERLARTLPEHMIPALFLVLDELPRLPNGKTDRTRLAEAAAGQATARRALSRTSATDPRAAPRTPVEELVAAIFREILEIEEIGRRDSFFTLGGHSLLATRVLTRIERSVGVTLPLRRFFETPTVADLAEAISAERATGEDPEAPPLTRRAAADADGPEPLSFAQERMWLLDQLEPGRAIYNVAAAVRLDGELRVEALDAALSEIARRHQTLRSSFPDQGGEPRLEVSAPRPLRSPVIDLVALSGAGSEAASQLAEAEARRPFDLVRGPLLRSLLLRLGANEHLLVLNTHHIISDGWSLGVLLREFATLYETFSRGAPSPLPELPLQYSDYARWQRGWLRGEVLARQLSYWREQLAGIPALELPYDRPRPAAPRHRGALLGAVVPEPLVHRLLRLANDSHATLFVVLLATLGTLLGRLSHRGDVAMGSPIANRRRLEIESLIGFFANTLVLRLDLGGDPSFRQLLGQAREVSLSADAHQDVPFEKVVAEVDPERDLSTTPLFQVMLALQNAPLGPISLGPEDGSGLRLKPRQLATGTAKFDLTLQLAETPAGLIGTLEYDRDLFDRTSAHRLLQRFERLLAGAASDPERRLSELPFLDPGERQQLAVEWSGPRAEVAARSLDALVELHAARAGDAVAIVDETETNTRHLSYGELARRARALARRLRRRGLRGEAVVAVSLERSIELVTALLGVLRGGFAYLPLDPAHPPERRARLLADSGAGALVSDADEARALAFDGPALGLAALAPAASEAPAETPAARSPDRLAYVIYTSGSTGEPKGVLVSHRNATRLFSVTAELFDFGPRDVWSLFHSAAFDFSVWEIWGALVQGARLAVVPHWVARDPAELARLLRRQRVSVLSQTPSAFAQLLPETVSEGFSALRQVVFGGEALELESLRAWLERFGERRPRLVNMYGITETTVHVTYRPLAGRDLALAGRSPLGRPLDDLALELLDRRGRTAALGTAGEIHVGGAGVARGYLGRPGLTAERFVPDPRTGLPGRPPGARLYRSGDLARRGGDGELFYLGRIDHQVKVRGFRVELGEIEAALRRLETVREAAVLARGGKAESRLVAYVVPAAETVATETLAAELRREVGTTLPEHMLPAAFDLLDALPLNANGKLDRAALLSRPLPAAKAATAPAPRTLLEELVAGVFCEILGVERAGPEDDFFALGGHSLLATRALSRLREVAAVEIPLRRLFEKSTVAALAAEVEASRRRDETETSPIPRLSTAATDAAPLSYAQERLWILERLEPGNDAYHMPFELRFVGTLSIAALELCLNALVERHAALRSTFHDRAGRPVQRTEPHCRRPLPVIDLSALAEPRRRLQARFLTQQTATAPFDLARGPLLRSLLLRLEASEHLLDLTFHHIVADGWSLGILMRELAVFYRAALDRKPPHLPAPELRYVDYAYWQRDWLRGEVLERQLAYWRQQLTDLPGALELPTDRPRPAVRTFRGGHRRLDLAPEVRERLEALGRRRGATLFMTLLAAFQALLYRLSGQADVAVGTPIAGRNRGELESLVGIFLNTLVLRADLAAASRFDELLEQVRAAALDAYAHQDLPFEKLLEELQPERDLSRTPLFQVFFNMLNLPLEVEELPGVRIEPATIPEQGSKFDLTLYAHPLGERLSFELVYNADLFSIGRVDELLRQYASLLTQVVEDPGVRIDALDLRTPGAAAVLPDPRLPLATGHEPPVHELVARRAAELPDRVAIADSEGHWSYRELGRQTARLARRLLAAGVGRGEPVLIFAHRSAGLAPAVLGTLASGAAFVLLDPAYPGPRQATVARRAGARCLLHLSAAGPLPVELTEALDELGAEALELPPWSAGRDGGPLAGLPAEPPAVAVTADDVASITFTSGSTGVPKGILGRHGPLTHFLPWQTRRFELGPEDRYSMLSGLAHDPLQRDLFTPLTTGATLVVPDPEALFTAGYLADWACRERIGVAHLTPAMAQVLSEPPLALDGEHQPAAAPRSRELPALRRVFLTGDVLTRRDVQRLCRLAPRAECVNLYGATETQRAVAYYPVGGEESAERAALPLGRGMKDVQLLVVGPGGRPAGIGELGEIWVRSPHLARGYLGDDALTRERFRPSPWSDGDPRDRVYLTGDLGRYLLTGDVVFAGRADRQVKIRGYRIELGEVESQLEALAGVREAVVLCVGENAAERRLLACVVPGESVPGESVPGESVPGEPPAAELAERLRDELRRRLPAHMVPAGIAFYERLPLTPNGKRDLRALAETAERRLATGVRGGEREEPRTELERTIAATLAELLGLESLGSDDNFFDLGANSLLLVRLHARLQVATGREFPAMEIFNHPTVRSLAAHLGPAPAAVLAPAEDDRTESLRVGRDRLRRRRARRRRAS